METRGYVPLGQGEEQDKCYCENGSKISVCVKRGEFLDHLNIRSLSSQNKDNGITRVLDQSC